MVASVLLAVLTIAFTSPVRAHDGETVTPNDGELLVGTPPQIRIQIPGSDPVEVELRRANGAALAFTGELTRSEGLLVAIPPVLEPGTYVLRWSYAGIDDSSSFSVGEPSATYVRSTLPARSPLLLALAATAFIVSGLTGAVLRSRGLRHVATTVLALLAAGVLSRWRGPLDVVLFGVTALSLAAASTTLVTLLDALRGTTAHDDARRRWYVPASAALTALLLPVTVLVVHGTSFTLPSLAGYTSLLVSILVVAPLLATWLSGPTRTTSRRVGGALAAQLFATLLALLAFGVGVPEQVNAIAGEYQDANECLTGTNRLTIQRCLESSLVMVTEEEGVGAALETLGTLIATNSRARFFCHEASHAVGRASLRLNGNLADAFRDGFDVCDFGYYHGIVEGAAGGFDDATFLAAVPTLCEDFASAEELFYMQCNHGIGHAAARRTNNDMVRALEFCDALEKNPQLSGERLRIARNGCGTGVTMEWFATATADPNAAVRPEVATPRDVCTQVPARWAAECVEYVGNTLDSSDPVNSLVEIGRWCTTTGLDQACFRGVARAAAGVGITPADAIAVCDTNAATREDCVSFYIAIVATTIDFDVSAVDRICAKLPESDRAGAFSLCERTRQAVVEVLAGSDGKARG
jgi:hypothetical protein